jgi:2-amino-4-hydroxy-6-hydroxymethyldihydropteridine diphosphokinase
MPYTWIATRHYPRIAQTSRDGHDALIGIGGNIGDTVGRFERLYRYWRRSDQVRIVQTSPILRNPPFGHLDQPDFYNALIHLRTPLDPHPLLRYLLFTEKRFGRVRTFANAPRTLDLDLIFYDDRTIGTSRLSLPHPHWRERDSVVMPLRYMKGVTPWSKRHS